MPEGVMILGQWSSMDGVAIVLLMLGLVGFCNWLRYHGGTLVRS